MSYVASLYTQLLDDQGLPASMQWRAYRVFNRENNEMGMARLAAHPALDPALDAEIASHKSVKVRAAWAARPDRRVEDLVAAFDKERRITMLEIGAQLVGMPDEWYARMLSNPSAKVAAHIVGNRAIGLKVRRKAARIWGEKATDSRSVWSAMSMLFAGSPELHDELATGGRYHSEILRFVAGSKLSLENQKAVLEKVIYPVLANPITEKGYSRYRFVSEAEAALVTAAQFGRQPAHDPELREELKARVKAYVVHSGDTGLVRIHNDAVQILDGSPESVRDTLAVAATTEDLAELTELVTQAKVDTDYDLALAIASNKSITVELLQKVIDFAGWHIRRDLVRHHAGNPQLFAVAMANTWEQGDDVLERCVDPTAALECYLNLSVGNNRSTDWVMQSKFMSMDMLKRLPFHLVASSRLSDTLRQQLIAELDAVFDGLDEGGWALFETVANASGASLADVLAATTAITAG